MQLVGEERIKIGWKSTGDESVTYSRDLKIPEARNVLNDRLVMVGGPIQLRRRGEDFGPFRSIPEARTRGIRWLDDKADAGDFVVFRGDDKHRLIIAKKNIIYPKIIDTDGTAAVDLWHSEVFARFKGRLSSFGICSCRPIAGTSSWSQHAYCNAEDVHGSAAVMEEVWDYTIAHGVRLRVAHVIYARRIWQPGGGVSYYGGTNPHYDHDHVDFLPQGSGLPACAGGRASLPMHPEYPDHL